MNVLDNARDLRALINEKKRQNTRVGFVPTMGNLHEGHLHLVHSSLADGCFTVASIFVNPLQFNDAQDLANYPRTLEADIEKLSNAGCDVLFCPSVDEMYPNGQGQQTLVHVPIISEGLCGASRPGHFDGVSTVVSKLFGLVQPDRAYFGEKDFQQLRVIQTMVEDLCMPIDVMGIPTVRADDGLALSSRNGYLSKRERALAPLIHQTLSSMADNLHRGDAIEQVIEQGREQIHNSELTLDYLEIRRQKDLATATPEDSELVIFIAAYLGNARLIDNLKLTLNQ